MACRLINFGQKIGSLSRNFPFYQDPVKLSVRNLKTTSTVPSSVITDSTIETKPNIKKKLKHLSTNIIHVGEDVSDKNAKVRRLRASEIPKIERMSQKLNIDDGHEKAPSLNTTDTTTTTTPSTTFNPYTHNEEGTTMNNEDALELPTLMPEEDLLLKNDSSEIVLKKNSTGKKKMTKDGKQEKLLLMYNKLRHKGRIQSFNHSLAAYLSVCIHCGFTHSAYQTFIYYVKLQNRQKNLNKYHQVLNLMPYNEILKGISSNGDFKKMKEVREYLKKSSLIPTYDTFAHILTCLGRGNNMNKYVGEIKSTLQWMDELEINLNDMFDKAAFSGDSFKYCLQSVERVIPDIKNQLTIFNPTVENLQKRHCYKNGLLDPLNESMFSHRVSSLAEGVLTREELEPLIDQQVKQEITGYVQIPTISVEQLSKNALKNRDLLEKWKGHWRKSLFHTVAAQKNFMHQNFISRKGQAIDFYPYFHTLDNEEIVNLLMLEINNLFLLSETHSSPFMWMCTRLGGEFFNRFHIKYKEKTKILATLRKSYGAYCDWYLHPFDADISYIPRVQWMKFSLDEIMTANLKDVPCEWPYPVKLSIGKLLYNIIFSSVMVWKPNQGEKNASPAFYKVQRTVDMKVRNDIKPSPILAKVCQEVSQRSVIFLTSNLPMLSPPVPWTDMDNGGYFISKSDFVRFFSHAHQQKRTMKEGEIHKLYPVIDSLNELSSIPWKINKPMLDIIIEVFNKKGWEELDISSCPSQLPIPPKVSSKMSSKEKKEIIKQRLEYKKKKSEMHSLWCDTLYKLSLANFYRDCIIWLPQNMDFRGRTYPIPPHMTHVSADSFRSLLLFAQGKKLDETGLYWLKLHVINLTGMKKKCSLQERMDFFEEVRDEISDSAKNPLTGNKWWTQSDDPWQTLAACMEVVAALESENPEEYVSHLPIHQDGSCNGLQHYAALGRDLDGAESVNLRPREIPQDVYSRVADLVERKRQQDAAKGLEIAKVLDGFVQRKVVKQTIMTTVYGVTLYGAKLQINKQLNYLKDFPANRNAEGSFYLADKVFESLGTIFSATKEIQNWLVRIAEGISKGCLKNVEWVTPLGFPVVQPYSQIVHHSTLPGMIPINYNDDFFLKPNVMKQKNAFAPNFIHSLDSSHMMLTSIYCQHAGITFVSVHDCFWTHASTVPIMNKICREQFVKLHSEPILEDFAKFVTEKYSNHFGFNIPHAVFGKDKKAVSLNELVQRIPKKGEFDLNEVLDSVFFFS